MYYDENGNKLKDAEVQELKEQINKYEKVCPNCESNQIGQISYVNINDEKVLDYFEPTTIDDVFKCFDCGEGVDYDSIQTRRK
jgi:predicted RNA-binding Zn-ribbon protein involved in translation (DUF1610 family)